MPSHNKPYRGRATHRAILHSPRRCSPGRFLGSQKLRGCKSITTLYLPGISCHARVAETNGLFQTAVATALIGFAISTFYTAAIHAASTLLPRRLHTNAMMIISSVGQVGSALFPFVIGEQKQLLSVSKYSNQDFS